MVPGEISENIDEEEENVNDSEFGESDLLVEEDSSFSNKQNKLNNPKFKNSIKFIKLYYG